MYCCWIEFLGIDTFPNPQPTVSERSKLIEVSWGWNEGRSYTRCASGSDLAWCVFIYSIIVKRMLSWWRLPPLMRCLELMQRCFHELPDSSLLHPNSGCAASPQAHVWKHDSLLRGNEWWLCAMEPIFLQAHPANQPVSYQNLAP